MAAFHGNKKIVDLLLKKGADVNASIKTGETPLFIAAEKGYNEIVETLIKAGADVSKARKKDHATPLHIAAEKGHVEVVALLLEVAGINVDMSNGYIETPLFVAVKNNKAIVVEKLREAGACDTFLQRSRYYKDKYEKAIADGKTLRLKRFNELLPKIKVGDVCPISNEVLEENGTIGGERAYSIGRQHLYKESSIRELLSRGTNGSAFDPMTRSKFREEDLIDVTDLVKDYFAAHEVQDVTCLREQGRNNEFNRLSADNLRAEVEVEYKSRGDISYVSNYRDRGLSNVDRLKCEEVDSNESCCIMS